MNRPVIQARVTTSACSFHKCSLIKPKSSIARNNLHKIRLAFFCPSTAAKSPKGVTRQTSTVIFAYRDLQLHSAPTTLLRANQPVRHNAITTVQPILMKLLHLPIPGITSYAHAGRLQDRLVRALLAAKSAPANAAGPLPPPPAVITAQFHPVYTTGRRDAGTLSAADEAHLRAGGTAEYHASQRGGQTTWHGPGQLVAYPVLDLRRHTANAPAAAGVSGLSPRCYVRMLESAAIATCAAYGVRAFTTENTGVWTAPDRKICAVGVHMRRFVTSHGVGLNVDPDLRWFERIVACGLEGMGASSLVSEGVQVPGGVGEVARVFVSMLARGMGVDEEAGVVEIGEEDVPF